MNESQKVREDVETMPDRNSTPEGATIAPPARGAAFRYTVNWRPTMPTSKIFKTRARLDDDVALREMLRPIREGELVRASLLKGESGRRQGYDETARTSRHIVSDGKVADCFTVTNVSLQQSAEIAAECDSITEWSLTAFRAAVERVLNARSDSVN